MIPDPIPSITVSPIAVGKELAVRSVDSAPVEVVKSAQPNQSCRRYFCVAITVTLVATAEGPTAAANANSSIAERNGELPLQA